MRHVSDDERRARLALRHALTPSSRAGTPEEVTEALTVLHATEAATVYLSYWARSQSPDRLELDRSLYVDRSLVKQLAMRRTLFVFPRDLLPATWGSASARVATAESNRIIKEVTKAGIAQDGKRWLERVRRQVLTELEKHPDGLPAIELRKRVPEIANSVRTSASAPGTMTQVLTYMGARADIVRAMNRGQWHTAQPRWATMRTWLGEVPESRTPQDGYRELVRRWLHTFGPGTESDIVWWLGSTRSAVRQALIELSAVEVALDGGATGWLLPGDLNEVNQPDSWVALLPSLDPTVMGWQSRKFYLGNHSQQLFDTQGNAGTTIWVDGRVVGYWTQDAASAVQLRFLEDVRAGARRELKAEATRLTEWLGGVRLNTVLKDRA